MPLASGFPRGEGEGGLGHWPWRLQGVGLGNGRAVCRAVPPQHTSRALSHGSARAAIRDSARQVRAKAALDDVIMESSCTLRQRGRMAV